MANKQDRDGREGECVRERTAKEQQKNSKASQGQQYDDKKRGKTSKSQCRRVMTCDEQFSQQRSAQVPSYSHIQEPRNMIAQPGYERQSTQELLKDISVQLVRIPLKTQNRVTGKS